MRATLNGSCSHSHSVVEKTDPGRCEAPCLRTHKQEQPAKKGARLIWHKTYATIETVNSFILDLEKLIILDICFGKSKYMHTTKNSVLHVSRIETKHSEIQYVVFDDRTNAHHHQLDRGYSKILI